MGHYELLTALRRKGEEQAAEIRRAAEIEEQEVRSAAAAASESHAKRSPIRP